MSQEKKFLFERFQFNIDDYVRNATALLQENIKKRIKELPKCPFERKQYFIDEMKAIYVGNLADMKTDRKIRDTVLRNIVIAWDIESLKQTMEIINKWEAELKQMKEDSGILPL